jgi:LacI family transcriptional regulator
MKKSSRPTLAHLANRVGVHSSTVSRALSNDPQIRATVSEDTVGRVRRAAEQLGYIPNRVGSMLRTGRSRSIAVLVPHASEYVVGSVYEGLDAAAAELGYATFVANTFGDEQIRRERIDRLIEWGVDAILYADARVESEDLGQVDGVSCWPIIRRGQIDHRFHLDDVLGGRLVARHLISSGYRSAAVIAGPSEASTFIDRVNGFLAEFVELGGYVDSRLIVASGLDIASGRKEFLRMLPNFPSGAAVFAAHDPLALGVYSAARSVGLHIGRDLGIVGFNDLEFSAQLPVSLTSVRWDFQALGRAVAFDVISAINGGSLESEMPSPKLIARQSTNCK